MIIKKYWFKRKLYGWGWTPASWEGWLVLGIFLALFLTIANHIDSASQSLNDTLLILFLPNGLSLILLLILICYITGEEPKWQWGEKEKKKIR